MKHKGTKIINTERLLLRRFCENDVETMFRNWKSDPKVTEFLSWPAATDISEAEETISRWVKSYESPDFYQWAIVLKEINEPIGSISVVGIDDKVDLVHIGYCIGSKWWRKGIVSEAFKAIIPFLFEEVGVNRIEARHDPDNPGSGKVMLKCGLKYEGTLRKALRSNKGITDVCVYGLLKSEWQENIQC